MAQGGLRDAMVLSQVVSPCLRGDCLSTSGNYVDLCQGFRAAQDRWQSKWCTDVAQSGASSDYYLDGGWTRNGTAIVDWESLCIRLEDRRDWI